MTKEEQRIAIAEKCGWRQCKCGCNQWFSPHEDVNNSCRNLPLPNYPEDLNAMHEAESHLTAYEAYKYNLILGAIEAFAVHATAQRKSEAFCRTLWPERFKI